ncbi:phosphoribosyltransferase [Corallococcus sp. CA049B]|uniref:phosphoribosyltransferase n=1 Tax=Corallococcus sp. CA049B TaxID=2316730 RepID=UPI000EA209F5|nr:phosphoribosyltransferase [Corallococcus sp. CA049B]NOJ92932.1 phosphoribosyltransferase [Corallococcus coralloides]RKG77382.1 phosphoribosyltransferase [Corallococcus sp. CA049B]
MQLFRDRVDAGRALGQRLRVLLGGGGDLLVLALPRGGVPVGFEVARILGVPLDVFMVRKLGTPGHEELAMGAIATGGVTVLNEDVVRRLGIPRSAIAAATERETRELARREHLFREGRPPARVEGRTVILVDDGLATGSTMRAALRALRLQKPARIVVGVPVGAPETCAELELEREADVVVCVHTPAPFYAVGQWFEDFTQTTDDEVRELLARAAQGEEAAPVAP